MARMMIVISVCLATVANALPIDETARKTIVPEVSTNHLAETSTDHNVTKQNNMFFPHHYTTYPIDTCPHGVMDKEFCSAMAQAKNRNCEWQDYLIGKNFEDMTDVGAGNANFMKYNPKGCFVHHQSDMKHNMVFFNPGSGAESDCSAMKECAPCKPYVIKYLTGSATQALGMDELIKDFKNENCVNII